MLQLQIFFGIGEKLVFFYAKFTIINQTDFSLCRLPPHRKHLWFALNTQAFLWRSKIDNVVLAPLQSTVSDRILSLTHIREADKLRAARREFLRGRQGRMNST